MTRAGLWATVVGALCLASPAWGAVVYKDAAEVTAAAQQIVVGDVVEVTSFWDDNHELIKSRVVVTVDQYLFGDGDGTEVLVMSGGTVDDLTLRVSVLPVFEEGDHVLLFLGEPSIRLVESYQGAYLTDGQQIIRMGPACQRVIEETRQPLSDFVGQVQRALPPGTVLPAIQPYQGSFVLPVGGLRYALCGYDWTYESNPMGESYKLNGNCTDGSAGSGAEQREQIQNGLTVWNNAGADFAFTYGGTSSSTSIAYNFTNLICFSNSPPDGGDYVAANYHWASGGDMLESDIVFNDADYTWWNGSGGCAGMDIWNVATHELGHTLCLSDLYSGSDSSKTMYGFVSDCDTYARSLHPDDINGIISIYGVGSPDNDECADAFTAIGGTYNGTTAQANSDGSAGCGSSSSSPDVWYKLSAAFDGTLTADTCGSSYDTVLSVHTGCPGTSSNQIACDDDDDFCGDGSEQSYVSVDVDAGNTYYLRVSGYSGDSGGYVLTVDGPVDDITPTPDPMTFSSPPSGISTVQIEMTASQATDVHTPPVEYQFDYTTGGGGGGSDSGWQSSRTYVDGGLLLNTEYNYRVRARDAVGNMTAYSDAVMGYTLAEAPEAPTLDNVGATSMDLTVHPGGNPDNTEFSIQCASATDGAWNGEYVDSAGDPSGSAVWRTAEQWGASVTIQGLTDGVNYCWHVQARNGDGIPTAFGPEVCAETSGATVVVGRSCRTHGSAGEFCVEIGIGDGARYTGDNLEWRLGGVTELEFDVSVAVTDFSATVNCSVDTAFGTTATPVADGSNTVTILFSPALPSDDCCTIHFEGGINDDYAIATVSGSVDENLVVNTLDFSAVKARFGQSTTASNYRYDVNTDGIISTLDSSAIKARFGNSLSSCP